MLTVQEAAARAGRRPETIRRWIRRGRLHATRYGRLYLVEGADVDLALADGKLLLPLEWQHISDGRPTPDVVQAIRVSRMGH